MASYVEQNQTKFKFPSGCPVGQYPGLKQLFLLDEGHIRDGALIEGHVLDDGDLVDTRWLLQSREAQPVTKFELTARFNRLRL